MNDFISEHKAEQWINFVYYNSLDLSLNIFSYHDWEKTWHSCLIKALSVIKDESLIEKGLKALKIYTRHFSQVERIPS